MKTYKVWHDNESEALEFGNQRAKDAVDDYCTVVYYEEGNKFNELTVHLKECIVVEDIVLEGILQTFTVEPRVEFDIYEEST